MKTKLKAFTLIELLLIVIIIGVIFRTGYYAYEKDRISNNILEGQQCANAIYGSINEYINLAKKKQAIYTNGGDTIYPDYYVITFSGDDNTINLNYISGGTQYFYSKLIISANKCYTDEEVTYNVNKDFSITVTPGFTSNGVGGTDYWSSFNIKENGEKIFSGEVMLIRKDDYNHYEIAKFSTNANTNSIKKYTCSSYSGGTCIERY